MDGFALAYEREGSGPPVVLLHGWPGDHGDYRKVTDLLVDRAQVIVPDLRGFGASDKRREEPARAYSAAAQARSVLGLIDELGARDVVIGGYDVGSRIAQAVAGLAPERLRAIVICPPVPGAGSRVLSAGAQQEFWYQAFHQLELAADLIDGKPAAVRSYLRHFWSHWSGPAYQQPAADLDRLVEIYAAPGAFTASIGWYRAGSGTVALSLVEAPPRPADRIAVPATVLWPEYDPLFPPAWSDRLDDYFGDMSLRSVPGVGHFLPLEAAEVFASAVLEALPAT